MSNQLYPIARYMAADAGHNWESAIINVCLVDEGYSIVPGSHQDFADLGGSTNHGTEGAAGAVLSDKVITIDGACQATDARWTSVSDQSGTIKIKGLAAYFFDRAYDFPQSGGTTYPQPLLFWIDTATGLTLTPNGGDVIAKWDTGINKIYML